MQIVIDIPEDVYKPIIKAYKKDKELQTRPNLYKAIAKGIILPKGHGGLIDVNDLLGRIGLEDNDSNREENVGEIITLEDFDAIPTIIEAESEDKE